MSRLPRLAPAAVVFAGILVAVLVNLVTDGLQVARWRWWIVGGLALVGAGWVWLEYATRRQPTVRRRESTTAMWLLPSIERPVQRAGLAASLVEMLTRDDARVVGLTTGLYGAGGFGKTTLAVQVCSTEEVRDRFPGGLLWATIGMDKRGADLAAVVNDLSAQLSHERPQFSDPEQAGRHLGQLLDERPPTLLVIDDVWTGDQVRPFMYGGRRATRLITSRNPVTVPTGAGLIHVDEMDVRESRELLLRGLPALPQRTVTRLLDLTGNWPLLLAMVNGAIHGYLREGVPADEAVDLIATQLAVEGPAFLDVRVEARREHAVRLTVAASLKLLPPEQREHYFKLGIFAEDTDIPLSMLSLLWGMPATETRQLCEDLSDLSLVKSYRRGSATLKLHDVIRDHLRHEMADRLPDGNKALLEAARSMLPNPQHEWWQLPRSAGYLWSQLTYHLDEAGMRDTLAELVCDLRWGEQKIALLGLPAYEVDLSRSDDPLAVSLRQAIARKGHLLGPIDPAHSHADLLVSRLGEVPELRALVHRYASTLSRNVPRLTNSWPIPPVDPALVRVLAMHDQAARSCAVAGPDGTWLVTTGDDGVARVWSTQSWSQRVVLEGHAGAVTGCAFSPDGSCLVTAGDDGAVRVWSPESWSQRVVLPGHVGGATGCAFSPDGRWLATAGADGSARLWSTQSWSQRVVLEGHAGAVTGCAFSPDGRWLATAGADGSARLWSTQSWSPGEVLWGHVGGATGCAFSPDGSWLATTGADGSARVWSTRTWTEWTHLEGHSGAVTACAFSPDGSRLVTTGADQTVRAWDTDSWAVKAVIRGHTDVVTGCAFAPDGSWLATTSTDHNARVWTANVELERGLAYRQNRSVTSCSVSPDSRWLLTTGIDGMASIWDVASPVERDIVRGHAKALTACAIAPTQKWFATAGADHTVCVWNADDHHKSLVLRRHSATVADCEVSCDGSWLATAGADGSTHIWDTASWQPIVTLTGGGEELTRCAFAPDGTSLLITSAEGLGYVFETRDWSRRTVLKGHSARIADAAYSPDGTLVATAGSDDRIVIWRTGTWVRYAMVTAHADAVTACSFAPNGAWLATVGGDSTIRIWEVTTWALAASMRTNGRPNDICWLPDSNGVFVGCVGGIYQFAFAPPLR